VNVNVDWKATIGKFAPIVAGMLGGPAAGAVAGGLCSILGLENTPENVAKVAEAAAAGNLTGDQLVALRKLESDAKIQLAKMGMDYDLQKEELVFKEDAAYLGDVQDARAHQRNGTFWMGVCILVIFAILTAAVLYGCFHLLRGGLPEQMDKGTVAVVFTLIGTIIGTVGSQAQTVINFEFGSSRDGSTRADKMADAVTNIASIQGPNT
jgi:hypothetical protein